MMSTSFAQSENTQQSESNLETAYLAASENGVDAYLTSRSMNDKTYLVLSLTNSTNDMVDVDWTIYAGSELYFGSIHNKLDAGVTIEIFDASRLIEIQPGQSLSEFKVDINL